MGLSRQEYWSGVPLPSPTVWHNRGKKYSFLDKKQRKKDKQLTVLREKLVAWHFSGDQGTRVPLYCSLQRSTFFWGKRPWVIVTSQHLLALTTHQDPTPNQPPDTGTFTQKSLRYFPLPLHHSQSCNISDEPPPHLQFLLPLQRLFTRSSVFPKE